MGEPNRLGGAGMGPAPVTNGAPKASHQVRDFEDRFDASQRGNARYARRELLERGST